MRTIYVTLILIFLFSSTCFSSVINECKAETTIHEVITQPTYEKSGQLVIQLNESTKKCLCDKLPSHDIEKISIDVTWSNKKNNIELLPQNKINILSQCGSTMGSDGNAINFNVWYIQKVLD